MADVAALLNQRSGSRQGNLNPILYRLAAKTANNVFHDTTLASSGVSGCTASIPSMCNNSTPSPTALTGGLAGYLLTTGYDLVTGWGSIDVNNLLNAVSPGFSIAATPSALSLSAGAATGNSATLTYTSLGGFSGVITQGCTVTYTGSGTPIHLPTCSFTAATVTLPANGAVTGTITIATTAPGGAGGSASAMIGGTFSRALSLRNPAEARNSPARTALPAIALGALLLGLLPVRRRRLSLLRSLAMACAIAIAAASLSGCGGGSSSTSTSTGPTSPGSTSGSYTISLTSISGTTTATPAASISLTIQ
jgi:hypothetical protein